MKMMKKLRNFILYQGFFSLIIVLLCTFISNAVSYNFMQKEMSAWLIENNNKLLKQYAKAIDSMVISNSSEIYFQILTDTSTNQLMRYYIYNPLSDNMLDTVKISQYMQALKESNDLINSVAIFYSDNHLLISSDKIRYDLFSDRNNDELQYYFDLLESLQKNESESEYRNIIEEDKLVMTRAILSGSKIRALVEISYNTNYLRDKLKDSLPPEFGKILVTDKYGNIIFDIDDEYKVKKLTDDPLYSDVKQGADGYYISKNEGVPCIVSYSIQNEWKYISIAPMNIYLEPVKFILENLFISAIITVLAGIIISIVISSYQSRPMKSIVELCDQANLELDAGGDTYGIIRKTLSGLMDKVDAKDHKLGRIMPVLQDNFILWLLSESPADADEVQDNMMLMQISFPYKNYCVIAIKAEFVMTDSEDYIDEFKQEYALAEMRLRFENVFSSNEGICCFHKKGTIILGFVNFNYDEELFHTVCDKLSKNTIYGYHIYSCSSPVVQDINDIADAAKNCVYGLRYSFIYPEKKYSTTIEISNYSEKPVLSIQSMIKGFTSWMKLKDYDRCLYELDRFVESVRKDGVSIDDIHAIMHGVALEIESESSIDSKFRHDIGAIISSATDILSFKRLLSDRILSLEKVSIKYSDNTTDKLIHNAKEYIMEKLTDSQLSLQLTAQTLGVSTAYLSRTFSEREGITFVEFITNAKMEYGRRLLVETDLTLNEISAKLNYASAQYFISRFKKHFGTTPSVYRKMNTVR